MKTVTMRAGLDGYVRQDRPDDNFGSAARLTVDGTGGSVRYAYIFFRKPFGKNAHITNGKFRLRLKGAIAGGPHVFTLKRVEQSWKEGRLNYTNRPDVDATNSADVSVTGGVDGELLEFDIGDMLADVAAGAEWFGVRLEVNTAGVKKLHSAESDEPQFRPELLVSWTKGAAEPQDLVPAGGRSISLAQPTLQWAAQSVARGEESQAEFEVEIASANATEGDGEFVPANVLHGPGWIASTLSEYDLSTTAFTIDDAEEVFWHVRTKEENGRVSTWSKTAKFRRDTKGVVTITNPPAPAANVVEETTPPFTHTFADRDQEATAYTLFQADGEGGWVKIWDRDRRKTSDLSITPPNKLIRSEGVEFKLWVDVYDDIDREDMKGDRAFVRAERIFTYERSGTPASIESLVVTPGPGPGVILEVERTAQPDFFAIKRNGEIVEDRIPSEDVIDVAPIYSIPYYGLKPRRSSEIEVEAVVLSGGKYKHSDDNPTEDVTPTPIGIWLVAPEKGIEIFFADREEPRMGIGKSRDELEVMGSRKTITLIDSVRGYEGTIRGILVDYLGVSSHTYKDRLETLEGWVNRTPIRLIMFDFNFPVEISVEDLSAYSDDMYRAEVAFKQIDEFTFKVRL